MNQTICTPRFLTITADFDLTLPQVQSVSLYNYGDDELTITMNNTDRVLASGEGISLSAPVGASISGDVGIAFTTTVNPILHVDMLIQSIIEITQD